MGLHASIDLTPFVPCSVLSLGFPEDCDLKGFTLTVVDLKRSRIQDIQADLNEPQRLGEFDLVIDPGTIEHCFHVVNALANAAKSVKLGGHIVHNNPVSMINHGYWNISPVLFKDFYEANGFEIKRLDMYHIRGAEINKGYHSHKRTEVPPETVVICIAKKVKDIYPFKFPIQEIYR